MPRLNSNMEATIFRHKPTKFIGFDIHEGKQRNVCHCKCDANPACHYQIKLCFNHDASFHPLSWISVGSRFFNSLGVNVLSIKVSNVGRFISSASSQNCAIAASSCDCSTLALVLGTLYLTLLLAVKEQQPSDLQ
jgi:hypothetical protein